ncbi:7194_t:CDS:2 [Cetraspora pellucida]|uniref:7194_t:CDS:1 n=1 Tax=Cetraspora pellucida TaxID=1433469 RepID=A0A9N8VGM7_9GLOM|nr:7194_t:CDS:2 [Cetraspora pellucida]
MATSVNQLFVDSTSRGSDLSIRNYIKYLYGRSKCFEKERVVTNNMWCDSHAQCCHRKVTGIFTIARSQWKAINSNTGNAEPKMLANWFNLNPKIMII